MVKGVCGKRKRRKEKKKKKLKGLCVVVGKP
jgi:hypothetical protein